MKMVKLIVVVVASAAMAGLSSSVSAQTVVEDVIVVPIDSVLDGEPGSVNPIASSPVPVEFQGAQCEAVVEAINQESVHDGNDLLITSGGVTVEVDDVESEAFGVTGATLPLTLGDSVDVSLRLGPDGRSSGGLVITINCPQVAPTTTAAPTSTEAPSTTPDATTASTQPSGGVAAGNQTQSPTLPATGPDGTTWVAIMGAAMLAAGWGFAAVARRSR